MRLKNSVKYGRPFTIAVVTLIGLGVVLLSVMVFGAVRGTEFSPQRFQRRKFVYYQMPILRLQVSPVWADDITDDLERYLRTNKLLDGKERGSARKPAGSPRAPTAPRRWDGVMWYEAGRLHRRGDASILVQYLDATNSDDELVWLKWTKDHPDLASKLWPAVASVARQKLYIFVPDLLAATGRATDPDRFAKQLDGILASRFQRAGAAAGELGNHRQAVDYYSRSLELAPERAAVLRQRAASYQALGDTQRATRDQLAAERVEG